MQGVRYYIRTGNCEKAEKKWGDLKIKREKHQACPRKTQQELLVIIVAERALRNMKKATL